MSGDSLGRCTCCRATVSTAGCIRCDTNKVWCGACSCVIICGCGTRSGCACPEPLTLGTKTDTVETS